MADFKWIKTRKVENDEGTTLTYETWLTNVKIESRKRHIPHANGSGTWDLTTYYVINSAGKEKQFYRLAEAKEFASRILNCEIQWEEK